MEEIRLLNSRSTLVYNTMLGLYSRMGMREKLFSLMREMEDKGIEFNEVTYNIKLNAYAESDLKRMEMLLLKMEVDPVVKVDFLSYVTAAKGYLKAGASEKASMVLKKAENLIKGPRRQFAYGTLMTFFAAMQNKEEVHRLVSIIRCCGNLSYGSYVYVFTFLEKLNDLDSAKKILIEWEEKNAYFDIRIPNLVISAYCKKGYVGEADVIFKRMIESGREPSAKTWSLMALGYYKSDQMAKAVDVTKKAFEASFPGWKPDLTTVAACIDYLKKIGDSDGIQDMVMLLEKYGSFSVEFKERLGSYVSMGKPTHLKVGAR